MIVTPTFPPPYDLNLFENDPPAPEDYLGLDFPIAWLDQVLAPNPMTAKTILLCDRVIAVDLAELDERTARPGYPLFVIVRGRERRIRVNVWRDRAEIDFWPRTTHPTPRETIFPSLWSHFVADLQKIAVEAGV